MYLQTEWQRSYTGYTEAKTGQFILGPTEAVIGVASFQSPAFSAFSALPPYDTAPPSSCLPLLGPLLPPSIFTIECTLVLRAGMMCACLCESVYDDFLNSNAREPMQATWCA